MAGRRDRQMRGCPHLPVPLWVSAASASRHCRKDVINEQRRQVAGVWALPHRLPAQFLDLSGSPTHSHPRMRVHGRLNHAAGLIGSLGGEHTEQRQPCYIQLHGKLFGHLTNRRSCRGLTGLGFTTREHETIRVPFANREHTATVVAKNDSTDPNRRLRISRIRPAHGAVRYGRTGSLTPRLVEPGEPEPVNG